MKYTAWFFRHKRSFQPLTFHTISDGMLVSIGLMENDKLKIDPEQFKVLICYTDGSFEAMSMMTGKKHLFNYQIT